MVLLYKLVLQVGLNGDVVECLMSEPGIIGFDPQVGSPGWA